MWKQPGPMSRGNPRAPTSKDLRHQGTMCAASARPPGAASSPGGALMAPAVFLGTPTPRHERRPLGFKLFKVSGRGCGSSQVLPQAPWAAFRPPVSGPLFAASLGPCRGGSCGAAASAPSASAARTCHPDLQRPRRRAPLDASPAAPIAGAAAPQGGASPKSRARLGSAAPACQGLPASPGFPGTLPVTR
uniref:Uncharacterized protein n=1 Tax=Myotis myotis TaxID=51298 RepID=A0A7J8AMW6_MYOMY|nr:hypothetical protein mMyoMyo1_008219 [Myotis myotis]